MDYCTIFGVVITPPFLPFSHFLETSNFCFLGYFLFIQTSLWKNWVCSVKLEPMSVRIRQKTMSRASDHLRISRFSYILVSFIYEKKHQKNFLKNIVSYWIQSLMKLCWQAVICRNCSQSEVWKEFSSEALTAHDYIMFALKTIKKLKVGIYPVVVKASLEPRPQNFAKTKIGANFGQLYLSMPLLPYRFFWWIL